VLTRIADGQPASRIGELTQGIDGLLAGCLSPDAYDFPCATT
jgi:hypothetical protein